MKKVNKLKDQLFLVTNNKQYDSLMNEIDHLKTEKSELETDVLNMLQEKESLDENVESMESNLENITKIFQRVKVNWKMRSPFQQMKSYL